ncbi:MAG: hypothetical protein A3J28_08100 [Acidobacteria bacterium RIFCSPLOWO2_12_FULL_60_22]|nr:MAG: hypothetical protein A3J28_08100 [Acidobacteria bacterium RIFCSPLOWO2_12_FULL_60_22]
MLRFNSLPQILVVTLLGVGLPVLQAATLPSTGLMGVVKSSDGNPMEGVAISARAHDKRFTTSVYTDGAGQYYFPPLADGQYRIWAQAVSFEAARSELTIASGKKIQKNFTMKALQNFEKQLSSAEWLDSLPDDTPQDARMKRIFSYTCSACHIPGFVLAKRFDAASWGMIIDYMIEHETSPDSANRGLIQFYKKELVEYLTRIRGPEPYSWKFKQRPRASGEATQIVVTEYDLPKGDQPDFILRHNGSDWFEGIPSKDAEGEAVHDAVVAKDGTVWFSDFRTPERTIGKLDPKTGLVTSYKLADKDGFAVRTHGIVADQKGNIWSTNGSEGALLKFDPKTEKFQRFPKQPSLPPGVGGMVMVDSKGNLWVPHRNGAFRLNPETGEYTEYKNPTPGGNPYGIAIDAEDNAWTARFWADRLNVVNGRTGEVSEVNLPPLDVEEIREKDREIGQRLEAPYAAWLGVSPLYRKGPRRLGADRRGDTVWVAEYYADKLAKINIHTKQITEYPVVPPHGRVYDVRVDKNHMVWLALMNADRLVKFNPFTEQFAEYPLPTRGTDIRFLDVDNRTDPPTIWLPYTQVYKIARVQFRTSSPGQTAVNGR